MFEFLAQEDPAAASDAVERILEAIELLERHPFIGRPVELDLRELVISHGKSGYVALYRVVSSSGRPASADEEELQVHIAAIRRQREAGFPSAP